MIRFYSLIALLFLSWPALAESVAITGATIFQSPKSAPIENGVIILTDEKIAKVGKADQVKVPDGIETIDASGKFITAGFWNSHVHYTGSIESTAGKASKKLQKKLTNFFLRWGFSTTVDTGSYLAATLAIKKRIDNGDVDGPKIIMMSGSFVPVGGNPFYVEPIQLPEFKDVAKIDAMIEEVLRAGGDGIKIFTGSWATPDKAVMMEADHIRAASDAAHKRGAMVISHPSDSDGARLAIENGVDILAHTYPAEIKGPWDKSLPQKMADRNMALVPTLMLMRIELDKLRLPAKIVDLVENNAIEQTAMSHKAGVQILFGTDVGFLEESSTTEELVLMERAGMDYKSILGSLTTEPASRFGYSANEGKVFKGYVADLVFLASDPRVNVTAFSDVAKVFRNGRVVYKKR